jgi:RNA polymerase sigma-32 factor
MKQNKNKKLPVIQSDLDLYMSGIRQYPILTEEEEHKIALLYWEKKELDAAHKLVCSSLKLVVRIAFDYIRTGFKIMDLIQEGNIGLMQAVSEFNPYKGVRLATYATWWIKAYVQNFIIKNWSLVKIGTTQAQRKLFYKLNKEKKRLEQMGFGPEVKLLSERLGVTEKEVIEMDGRLRARDISLSKPVGDEQSSTLMDFQKDTRESIEDVLSNNELKENFEKLLLEFKKKINEKELFILLNRLLSEEPLTLQDIGDKFKITRERIRQIEENLKKKLKSFISQKMPDMEIK